MPLFQKLILKDIFSMCYTFAEVVFSTLQYSTLLSLVLEHRGQLEQEDPLNTYIHSDQTRF